MLIVWSVEASGSADDCCVVSGAFASVAVVSACGAWAGVYAGEVAGVVGINAECFAFGPGGFVVDGVGVGVAAFVAEVGHGVHDVCSPGPPSPC